MELLKALEEGLRAQVHLEVNEAIGPRIREVVDSLIREWTNHQLTKYVDAAVKAECGAIGKSFVVQDGEPIRNQLKGVEDDLANLRVTVGGSMDSAGLAGRIDYLEERVRQLADRHQELTERVVNPDIAYTEAGSLESEVELLRNQLKELDGMKLRIDRLENRYQQTVSRSEFNESVDGLIEAAFERHTEQEHDDTDLEDKWERFLESSLERSDVLGEAVKSIIENDVSFEVRVS